MWEWVKKGVPLRVEVGPRDIDGRRGHGGPARPRAQGKGEHGARASSWPASRASSRRCSRGCWRARAQNRDDAVRAIDTRDEIDAFFTPKNEREIHGGFALSHWCGDAKCETDVKEALKVTIRCIPTGGTDGAPWGPKLHEDGPCVVCGKPGKGRVVFAKSY